MRLAESLFQAPFRVISTHTPLHGYALLKTGPHQPYDGIAGLEKKFVLRRFKTQEEICSSH